MRQVVDEPTPVTLQGHLAIGHPRHCWTGGSCWATAQPAFNTNAAGGRIALAHDGNLTTTAGRAGHLMPRESPPGWPDQAHAGSDTDVIAELLAREAALPLEEAIVRTMPRPGALTATAASAGIGPVRGPRAAGSRRAIRCRCRTLRSPTSGRPPPPSRRPVRCRTPSEVAR